MVLDRALLEQRLRLVVAAFDEAGETEETRLEEHKLDALSEFAAGAGHELNNPLAVVVGRAQLLLSRTDDPETARSLRIMINQAGRAHRILRDLMFVGRPPARRPRTCRPSELLRDSVRDFQEECTAKGIRLSSEIDETVPPAWTDPDALRHLADIFIRNAMQATPSGGKIQVGSRLQKDELLWWFLDSGRGLESGRGGPPLRPLLLRAPGRPRTGNGPSPRRPDRRQSRRPASLDITPGAGDGLPRQSSLARQSTISRAGNPFPLRDRRATASAHQRASLAHGNSSRQPNFVLSCQDSLLTSVVTPLPP